MGISIGLVGLGAFGGAFVHLFTAHPQVGRVALCDREPDRIARYAKDPVVVPKFNEQDAYTSLEELLASDVDAVVIITQPWLHAPQAIQAMEAGKHVYSAVPIIAIPDADEILDWCDKLVQTCTRTGQRYMLGETTIYRPQTMYCRRRAAEGAFGTFRYSEGEYMHPYDLHTSDLRQVARRRHASASGREWLLKRQQYVERGVRDTPMTYPTHSVSGPMSVMRAHAVKVCAMGTPPASNDTYFENTALSNVTALFSMSNGTSMRICEHREVAYPPGAEFEHEIFRVFGTHGSFRENRWGDKEEWHQLTVEEMRDPLPPEVADAYRDKNTDSVAYGGHGGSHAYLAHEFVDAVANDRMPEINVWEAARYMAAGATAHKSALRDGELLEVPDWGDAPE